MVFFMKHVSVTKKETALDNRPLGSGAYGGGVYITAASITKVLLRMQAFLCLRGDMAEIGVLEGVYLRQLYSFLNANEVCYAVDPYLELSGLKEKVKSDFEVRYGLENQVHFLYESSLDLSPEMLEREESPGIRFFSIDGNHTEKYVLNDLIIAQRVLVTGGIIAIDDYFDPYSPGVSVGMARFFIENNANRLAILISGGNKVFLTTKADYFRYRLLIKKFTNIKNVRSCSDKEWFGHSVFFVENILSDNLPL
jgi:hypothetical protein